MDYSQYENYGFDRVSAFNLSTGCQERSYQAHWHSYGEFVLVGPGDTNIFMVNQRRKGIFFCSGPWKCILSSMRTERILW